jgi:hypothetical protein
MTPSAKLDLPPDVVEVLAEAWAQIFIAEYGDELLRESLRPVADPPVDAEEAA